ncbi:MAG: DNA polymerase III subunit gamma/tau [Ignavibacteria bacterium]|nr:DNA polymerase III subunit gamma/tau [Ignavibacteria bacterium]
MTEYIVTARKWRPMRFEDVAGQQHVTVTLKNAIAANRIAHAYLFSGPRGVGKTTTARLLAKAVNCLNPSDHREECEVCREITEGRSFDVLEIDGASNRGVEEIRNLRESVRYPPAKARYKVYIIDEVHMLTKEAFNALLKTLEEPPPHVMFIFATTEIQKVPQTILSRCQRFDFRRIAIEEIKKNLKTIAATEGITIDDDALLLIARKGDGSLRDAQSLFDQVVSLCGIDITLQKILEALNIVDQDIFFRVTSLIEGKDAPGAVALVNEIMEHGYDLREFLAGLNEHFRNLLITATTKSTTLLEVSDVHRKRYAEEASRFTVSDLLRMIRFVNGTETALRWSAQPRFKLEADMIQLVTMPGSQEVGELIREVKQLKKKLDDGNGTARSVPVVNAPPPATSKSSFPAPPRRVPLFSRTHASPPGGAQSSGEGPAGRPPSPAEGEIIARWPEVIAELRQRQRLSLASILDSSKVLAASEGVVRIGCSNDFQASSITRGRELLSEVFHKVFNGRARIDVEISSDLYGPAGPDPDGGSKPSATLASDHPVIQAIIKELGAEPLE